jgi:peptidoglycan/LPS O-acetylase OafA/YrhL
VTISDTHSPRRRDIQGLRAIAVFLVVIYHALPGALKGGFVGVDVFFVISGFLITGLLLRELDISGRIRLGRFYARRIRRLLPAALTVTTVTLIVAAMVYGPLRFVQALQDAAWSTVSLANVNFGMDRNGYFAPSTSSPFLHFWSLSVEEQFYLLWPVALIGAWMLWKRRGIVALLAAVLMGSVAASVLLTSPDNSVAYYSLATRAWELAVGGIIAWAVGGGAR